MRNINLKFTLIVSFFIFVFIPLSVHAASRYGDYLYYEINDDNSSVTIIDCSTAAQKIIIPDKIDGFPITNIKNDAFYGCYNLSRVYISDLEAYLNISFENSYACPTYYSAELYLGEGVLEELIIPDTITKINPYAFYNYKNLKSVTIPKSVKSIMEGAFGECTGLEKIYITDLAAYLNIDFQYYYANPMRYAKKLYINNKRAINVNIPDNVTIIPKYAFAGCNSIKTVTIPDSVKIIDYKAFANCTSLENITIPDSVEIIKESAFSNCINLSNALLGCGLQNIERYAFSSCNNLNEIDIPKGINTIERYSFAYCSQLKKVIIPDSVQTIEDHAFYECYGLETISLGCGLKTINDSAFGMCNNLNGVYITDITSWCNITFEKAQDNPLYYSKNLYINETLSEEIILPSTVTNINKYIFYNCKSLKKIIIGNNISLISADTFTDCSNLETLVLPAGITEIEDGAFSNCNNISVIEYKGNSIDWDEVYVGYNNGNMLNSNIYFDFITVYYLNDNNEIIKAQNVEKNTSFAVLPDTVSKAGYEFVSWTSCSTSDKVQFKPNDIITVCAEDFSLYPVWKKIIGTKTERINDIFIVHPDGVEKNNCIIFACFSDNKLTDVQFFNYNNEPIVPFTTCVQYENIFIFVWDGIHTLIPLCTPEKVL